MYRTRLEPIYPSIYGMCHIIWNVSYRYGHFFPFNLKGTTHPLTHIIILPSYLGQTFPLNTANFNKNKIFGIMVFSIRFLLHYIEFIIR